MRDIVFIHPGTKPQTPPTTTISQMARDLGVDFRPESLQLTCLKLAREVESLRFRVALVETELRTPLWRKIILRWRSR